MENRERGWRRIRAFSRGAVHYDFFIPLFPRRPYIFILVALPRTRRVAMTFAQRARKMEKEREKGMILCDRYRAGRTGALEKYEMRDIRIRHFAVVAKFLI